MVTKDTSVEAKHYHSAWAIREGEATPEEARAVLDYFCHQVADRASVPPWLLDHFAECFRSFLSDDRSLDVALGVKRGRRGRKSAIDQDRGRVLGIVQLLLERRIAGLSLEVAVEEVSEVHHLRSTQIRAMWRDYKDDALMLTRINREHAQQQFTSEEIRRLMKIFPSEQWLTSAGKRFD